MVPGLAAATYIRQYLLCTTTTTHVTILPLIMPTAFLHYSKDLKKIINSRLLQNKVYLKQPRERRLCIIQLHILVMDRFEKKTNSVFRFWEFSLGNELNANLENRFFYFSPNFLGRFFKVNFTKSAEKLWKIGKKNGPKLGGKRENYNFLVKTEKSKPVKTDPFTIIHNTVFCRYLHSGLKYE